MSQEILKRGTKIGRYEIRALLGRGGMGEVYRAWDPSLRRDVAIKVLGAPDEELLRRFSREAEAISQLNHPNVVGILDFCAGPIPSIVMPYLRGEDLSSRLKRGRIPVGEAVDIILGVCAGVHACHLRGVIHRDLKPGNVFLHETADGIAVKVLDFGVAILGEEVSGELTQPGQVVGTPRYFSPEQVQHVDADAKSDQYAVGLLLYVAMNGKSPFANKEGTELIRAILKADYARLREVRPDTPVGLEAAILRAMSVEKAQRYPSVLDFGRAIWEHATSEGRIVWADTFAPAGDPTSLPAPPATLNSVELAMANPTNQHSVSTVVGWASDDTDDTEVQTDTSGEKSPRTIMAAAVVVPLAPLEEYPVVSTTRRLRSETAIDVSQGKPDLGVVHVAPTVDLHLWTKSKPDVSPAAPPPWRHKSILVAAMLVAILGGCATWLLIRVGGR